jgi:two-component system OmpR family response regulator
MRILVIDDDPGVRVLCRIAFRTEGDEIVEAASGRDALEILATEPVDAVVLDVMLPSVNGFEILRRIREDARTSDLPVVLLSVRVGIQDQIDGWRAGADDYLTKPFSPSALAAKVYEICSIDGLVRAEQRAERLEERVTLPGA